MTCHSLLHVLLHKPIHNPERDLRFDLSRHYMLRIALRFTPSFPSCHTKWTKREHQLSCSTPSSLDEMANLPALLQKVLLFQNLDNTTWVPTWLTSSSLTLQGFSYIFFQTGTCEAAIKWRIVFNLFCSYMLKMWGRKHQSSVFSLLQVQNSLVGSLLQLIILFSLSWGGPIAFAFAIFNGRGYGWCRWTPDISMSSIYT